MKMSKKGLNENEKEICKKRMCSSFTRKVTVNEN